MATLDKLMEQAQEQGPRGESASAKLAELGLAAAPSIIDVLRQMDPQHSASNLQSALANMRDPGLVPLLIDVIDEKSMDLVQTVFEVLGRTPHPRSLQALQAYVSDEKNRETRKALAVDAIGALGNARAVPQLIEVMDTAVAGKMTVLGLATVLALAKLGDHSKAGWAIQLATGTRDVTIRPAASMALQYLVAPGLFAALQKIRKDKQVEVRLNAIDALLYLGAPQSVDELLAMCKDREATVATMARARLGDLTGNLDAETATPRELASWWEAHRAQFSDGVCHRLGAPLHVPDIIALLDEPNMRERTLPELEMITGVRFSTSSLTPVREQNDVVDTARAWWKREGAKQIPTGGLYKYGHEQELSVVFQEPAQR
jgi:HEAT repeat protein